MGDTSAMTNSKQKGKRMELLAAKALTATLGVTARRSVQYSGASGDADLTTSMTGVHFEVKSRAKHSCLRFYEQAKRDAAKVGSTPVVMLRENGDTTWYVLLELAHLRTISAAIESMEPFGEC